MDASSSAFTSFSVHAAGVEIGRATLSLPHSDPLHRGPFQPGPNIDQWPELLDRAMETAHKHPDSPLGLVLVDPRTAARVARVVAIYGPPNPWEIVVRFDTLSDGDPQTEGAA